MRNRLIRCISVALCLLLTGCSVPIFGGSADSDGSAAESSSVQDGPSSLGQSGSLDYEVPVQLPNILVDQVGYSAAGSKTAIFLGTDLPDTFDVVDAETGEAVYTGTIEAQTNRGDESRVRYGEFTEFAEEGTYYLQAAAVGESYTFSIAANPYDALFLAVQNEFYESRTAEGGWLINANESTDVSANADTNDKTDATADDNTNADADAGTVDSSAVKAGCQTLNNMLLAYEMYSGVFGDDTGIPESGNGIPDILDEGKYETDWLFTLEDFGDASAYAAASLAWFGCLYQPYDYAYANQCLRAAETAYRAAQQTQQTLQNDEETAAAEEMETALFHAAAELYRLTGYYSYRNIVQNYMNNKTLDWDNDNVFWGAVSYLLTTRSVDVNLCDTVIAQLLSVGETISSGARSGTYLTQGNEAQDNNADLLSQMARLSVVDHIITNYEYETVLENHLHYFLGRNAQSICYLDNVGHRNYAQADASSGIMRDLTQNAKLLLMMSAIESSLLS